MNPRLKPVKNHLWILVFLVLLTPIQNTSASQTISDSQALRAIFSGEGCVLDCFMGIRPGVADEAEFTAILAQQGIQPTQGYIFIYWTPNTSQFGLDKGLSTRVWDDHIEEISGGIEIPIETVIEVFGEPAAIIEEINNFDVFEIRSVYLVYPQFGLAFRVRVSNPTHTSSFNLTEPRSFFGWSNDYLYPGMQLQHRNCTMNDTWPCVTPTPAFTLSKEAVISAFSGFDCQFNCFLGIEPGITHEQDFLVGLGDAETVTTVGTNHTSIYWNAPNQLDYSLPRVLFTGIHNGYVDRISGRINIPQTMVIDIFGLPTATIYRSLSRDGTKVATHFIYSQYGLSFTFWPSPDTELYTVSFEIGTHLQQKILPQSENE